MGEEVPKEEEKSNMDYRNNGLDFKQTSYAFPESYDVYLNNNKIGCVIYENYNLTVHVPNEYGTIIFKRILEDKDGFHNVYQRDFYLDVSAEVLYSYIDMKK